MTKNDFILNFVNDLNTHFSIIDSCIRTDNKAGVQKMNNQTKAYAEAAYDVGYSRGFNEGAMVAKHTIKAQQKAKMPKRDAKGRFLPKWCDGNSEF